MEVTLIMGRLRPDLEELRVKGLRALAKCLPVNESDGWGGCYGCPYGGCDDIQGVTICIEALEDIRKLLEALGKEGAL